MKKKNEVQFLCFRVGQYLFGLDVQNAVEIIGLKGGQVPVTPITDDNFVYEGQSLKSLHLAELLLGSSLRTPNDYRVIIAEKGRRRFGLLVDSAEEIIRVTKEDIIKPESLNENLRAENISGMIIKNEKAVYIINIKKLLETIAVT
jgi:chemotaxis signal transduction protein